MRFIRNPPSLKEITSLALSPNKRFLAVAEKHKGDPNPYLSFYDMKSVQFKQIKGMVSLADQLTPIVQNPKEAGQSNLSTSQIQHQSSSTKNVLPAQALSTNKQILSLAFSNDSKYLAFIYAEGADSKAVALEWFHRGKIFG